MKTFIKQEPNRVVIFFLIIGLFISCKHNDTLVPGNSGQIINPSPVHASVMGKVVDQNEHAIVGATVKSGSHITSTDNKGFFQFDNIEMDQYASVVTVNTNGFFTGIRTFSAAEASSNFVRIKLIPKILTGSVDASTGGATTLANGSLITLEANSAVIKSTGQSYNGNINIYAAAIDPTSNDIAEIIPGSFQGTDENNYRVLLKSYGMLGVQLESESGEPLQITTGKNATLRFAIPASLLNEAPATIPLWSLDETNGLWKQEGSATKTAGYYEGNVGHFSFWNIDMPNVSVNIDVSINTQHGPLQNALVKITKISNGSFSYDYSNSSGHVSGFVFANEPLLLEVINSCDEIVYSKNLGPYTQNTNLGTILVSTSDLVINVTGTAENCNAMPVSDGKAFIYWDGHLVIAPITNGSFSTTIMKCSPVNSPVEIIVTDNITHQASTTWSGTSINSELQVGALTACSIAMDQYINYSVDGIDHALIGPADSIDVINYSSSNLIKLVGVSTSGDYVNFYLHSQGLALGSSQELETFHCPSIAPATLVTFNPLIFASITEYGNVGEYISGNFAGTLVATQPNATHSISCSFRVKRSF